MCNIRDDATERQVLQDVRSEDGGDGMRLIVAVLITAWISGSVGFVIGGVFGIERGRQDVDSDV